MCREVEMHGQDYRQSSVCDHQVSAPQRGKGSDARERCALTLKAGQGMAEREIRTLDSLAGMPVFKTGDINHSAISRTILSLCGFARRFPTTETKHRRPSIICSPAIVFQKRTFTCATAKAKAFPNGGVKFLQSSAWVFSVANIFSLGKNVSCLDRTKPLLPTNQCALPWPGSARTCSILACAIHF